MALTSSPTHPTADVRNEESDEIFAILLRARLKIKCRIIRHSYRKLQMLMHEREERLTTGGQFFSSLSRLNFCFFPLPLGFLDLVRRASQRCVC